MIYKPNPLCHVSVSNTVIDESILRMQGPGWIYESVHGYRVLETLSKRTRRIQSVPNSLIRLHVTVDHCVFMTFKHYRGFFLGVGDSDFTQVKM